MLSSIIFLPVRYVPIFANAVRVVASGMTHSDKVCCRAQVTHLLRLTETFTEVRRAMQPSEFPHISQVPFKAAQFSCIATRLRN